MMRCDVIRDNWKVDAELLRWELLKSVYMLGLKQNPEYDSHPFQHFVGFLMNGRGLIVPIIHPIFSASYLDFNITQSSYFGHNTYKTVLLWLYEQKNIQFIY